MDVNTLLKVLEQLLHKIKANRRREMVMVMVRGARAARWEDLTLVMRQFCSASLHLGFVADNNKDTPIGQPLPTHAM